MVNSISGINLKIGADLSDLKKEVGTAGEEVRKGLEPSEKPVQDLSKNFEKTAGSAARTAISAAAIAVACTKIGKAMLGWTKGILEDALAVHPETKQKVDDVKAAFDNMKVTLGESLIPLIDEWAPKLTEMLNNVSNWASENPEAARTMLEIVAALGVLSSALGIAMPIIAMFNLSMLSINAPVLAVAAAIGGVVAIVALLNATLFDTDESTRAFTGNIEEIDKATETLKEDAYGNLVIDKYEYTDWFDPATGEEVLARYDDFTQTWITKEQDLANAVSETTDVITEQTDAMSQVSDSGAAEALADTAEQTTETTKSAAEQAEEILQNMQQSIEAVTGTTDTGMSDQLTQVNELLESEAFKQFANQPVNEEVAASWSSFGEAVGAASEGFATLSSFGEQDTFVLPTVSEDVMTSWQNFAAIFAGSEEEGTVGLVQNLTSVKTETDNILTSMQTLAAYMTGDFVKAVGTLIEALCIVTTDEEGNTEASGGNTLYNALGSVSGVLGDILKKTKDIEQEWTGSFVSAVEEVKKASGKAEGALEGIQTAANNAGKAFADAAANVRSFLQALQDLDAYKRGRGGSSTGTGSSGSGIIVGAAASGAHVGAGDTWLVGENGPELFTPHRSGYIIPNDELMGRGDSITVNVEGSIYGESYLENYVIGKLTKAVRNELILAS